MKKTFYSIVAALAVITGACVLPHPPLPTDVSNPLKRVAILPMRNDTADVDGPEVMRKKMAEALEHHSYVVKDIKETDQILRDRMGITLGGQLDMTTAKKLGEALGVEGVLYGTLLDFDETTAGVIAVKKVRGQFKLVNTATNQSFWSRGLGVRNEQRMAGAGGAVAALATRAADAKEKEAPWVLIGSTSNGSDKVGESFAKQLGGKLLTKAMGIHLDYESKELARLVTDNLPWGPGSGALPAPPPAMPKFAMPEPKTPAPPSFGYMDWEGKRDFSALVVSTNMNKGKNEPIVMEFPLAVAGRNVRMDMDMTKTFKSDAPPAFSKMVMIGHGAEKKSFTLYPNVQKFMMHDQKETDAEKPKVEKTKVGSETIDGHPTDKYKVRITYKNERSDEGFIWNATDLGGMTIKSEVENNDYKVTTELKNIVLKTPAASLFEIPAGYTEAQSFMSLMTTDQKTK
jgi:hypothetical protein